MSDLIQWLERLWAFYHSLDLRTRTVIYPLAFGTGYTVLLYLLERLSGGRTDQYRTGGFLQDVVYWFWHSSGLYKLIFTTSVLTLVTPYVHVFQINLLGDFSVPVRGVIYYLTAELIAYGYHRGQHASRLLWAFHTTHHSQRYLSFATFNRFHPIDEFLMDWVSFVPITMLGASIYEWVPLYYLHKTLVYGQHSQVNWRFRWLEWLLVTPVFHSVHHSSDPRHHHHNFGATLSVWDHLFGTALIVEHRPEAYGLSAYPNPTLVNTFVGPFRLAGKALTDGAHGRDDPSELASVGVIGPES